MKKMLTVVIALTMIGCTSKKECEPEVVYLEQKFPRLATLDLNKTIEIPTYKIARDEIEVIDDVNVTMSIDTFWKIKDGDNRKVDYVLRRLKVFMLGAEVLNDQAKKYNEKFVKEQDDR